MKIKAKWNLLKKRTGKRFKRVAQTRVYKGISAFFCVALPPLGVLLVHKSGWNRTQKWALRGLAAAILAVFVVVMPSGDVRAAGGKTLIGSEKQAKIYGPEIPVSIVEGYTAPMSSVLTDEVTADITYYYAAKTEECYHEYTCSMAYASSQKLTLYEAYYLGYEPCPRCKPPRYMPVGNSQRSTSKAIAEIEAKNPVLTEQSFAEAVQTAAPQEEASEATDSLEAAQSFAAALETGDAPQEEAAPTVDPDIATLLG